MNNEEIIEMAIEAEFVSHGKPSDEESELFVCVDKDIYKFAKLVAAKEREAITNVFQEMTKDGHPYMIRMTNAIATIIRARGEA